MNLEQVRARLAHARAVTQAVFELMAAAREATAELPSAARPRSTGAQGDGRIEAARAVGRGPAGKGTAGKGTAGKVTAERDTALTEQERTRALRQQRARLRRLLGEGHRPLLEPARVERGSGDQGDTAARGPDARGGAAEPWPAEGPVTELARAQGSVPAAEALRLLRPGGAGLQAPEAERAQGPRGPSAVQSSVPPSVRSSRGDSPGARVE